MTREEFVNVIYPKLTDLGYRDVKVINGEPYHAKDMYFCPQAPELYMLTILPGRTEIKKIGKNGFRANLSTQVRGDEDIDSMHEEINRIIFNSDESSLKNKSTGCLAALLFLLIPSSVFFYLNF
ncbi:hypothetical protein [[Muricauda] lutisoli]|uniref:Uncharacterized protein n=1 Tax=[Muricauda] lutisoli TaxID=2816035 RepID=A0ABS3EU58_9FLAO|nr:hypothetical protein [[Muricauda] lutisoli]MBO0329743.1 hypothetical protein [[Muricauda] lutisoli]